jgi:hypothetical protein
MPKSLFTGDGKELGQEAETETLSSEMPRSGA